MRRLVLPEDMKYWTLDVVKQLRDINAATLAPGSLKSESFLWGFRGWVLESRGVGFRGYGPTALKVPHPHAVPGVGVVGVKVDVAPGVGPRPAVDFVQVQLLVIHVAPQPSR